MQYTTALSNAHTHVLGHTIRSRRHPRNPCPPRHPHWCLLKRIPQQHPGWMTQPCMLKQPGKYTRSHGLLPCVHTCASEHVCNIIADIFHTQHIGSQLQTSTPACMQPQAPATPHTSTYHAQKHCLHSGLAGVKGCQKGLHKQATATATQQTCWAGETMPHTLERMLPTPPHISLCLSSA